MGNVKALYRRTLARKGLGRLEEALRGASRFSADLSSYGWLMMTVDIEEVLQLEHGNEAAVSELEELKGLKERARAQVHRSPVTPFRLRDSRLGQRSLERCLLLERVRVWRRSHRIHRM